MKQMVNKAVMASLPYDDPFADEDEARLRCAKRGRTIKVKYNLRTALIQGFSEDVLTEENVAVTAKATPHNPLSRPSTCSQARTKRPRSSTTSTQHSSASSNYFTMCPRPPIPGAISVPTSASPSASVPGSMGMIKPLGQVSQPMSYAYGTLSSILKRRMTSRSKSRPNNILALHSFLAQLKEQATGVHRESEGTIPEMSPLPSSLALPPRCAGPKPRRSSVLSAASAQKENFISFKNIPHPMLTKPVTRKSGGNSHTHVRRYRLSTQQQPQTRLRPRSMTIQETIVNGGPQLACASVNASVKQSEVISLASVDASSRNLSTTPATAEASLNSTLNKSKNPPFCNNLLKAKLGLEANFVLSPASYPACPVTVPKIGEEEIEESPDKVRLAAKY